MKVYCLSNDASKPCFVVSFNGVTLMLDCGLSATSLLSFLPQPPVPSTRLSGLPNYTPPHVNDPALEGELKECHGRVFVDSAPEFCPPLDKVVDFSQLDAILISNYTCMLALPYITEGTGFRGQVLATEPTLQIGRFYLDELGAWLGDRDDQPASRWKELLHLLPPPLCELSKPRAWRRLYSREAVARALARVRVVGYDEAAAVHGTRATPVSSGYCLGSANWVVEGAAGSLAYVSGSSTLTTHPRPANQAALRGADALLLAALTQTPAHNPDNMLGDLCMHAAATLRAGGCVLLPVYPSGVLFDLLECLSAHLEGAGLGGAPMFLLGPAAAASLAYANILAEWLSGAKAARVFVPEEPFPHAALVRSGRLRHYPHVHDEAFSADFRSPCVVFCGHPSLRFGDAVHFAEMWRSDPHNAIIFTEPDFPHRDALAPFRPLAMKTFYCPIDTSLNFSQASKLVRELRPGVLALPEQYRGLAGWERAAVLRRGGVASLRLRRARAEGVLRATGSGPGAGPGPGRVSLELVARDSRLELRPLPCPGGAVLASAAPWGAPSGPELARRLAREGLEARLEGGVLHAPRHDLLLRLEPHATHVFCGPDPALRRAVARALRACLPDC